MATDSERQALAKLCRARDWSKAIRVLDSLLSQSCAIQDICNRAFCYSQLELHKHVIKDCDKALDLDPTVLQAYILKGHAMSALGKKEDALLVWEQGYESAVHQLADLKQLMELEELLAGAKQNQTVVTEDQPMESSSTLTTAVCEDQPMESSTVTTASDSGCKIRCQSSDRHEAHSEPSDASILNQNIFPTSISKNKSISLDFRLSRGIAQVNEGKYDQAVSIFDQILRENPTSPEALIGRGTAYAFQRELDNAVTDFTKAIQSDPSAGEAWKRRGQARAALGECSQAIEDLTKALEFEPNSSDILHERGIVNFKFKDYNAAVEDLSSCVRLDRDNKSAYTYLGLALLSIGEYRRAEEAQMKSIQLDPNFLEGWIHLAQFYQELAKPEKVLECIQKILLVDERFAKAYHLRGLLQHGMGAHRNAIRDLSDGLSIESSNIECLYLRASCYHAIGEYADAVKDYDALLDIELDSMDKFMLQCLAFYQKELALYTASKVHSKFLLFDIDGDISPVFKEYWCKRLHPKEVCEKVFRQPPLQDSLKKGLPRPHDIGFTKQKSFVLHAADNIGKKIHYSCLGFLPNRRQHRMAGLAAIEIAQKVSKVWRSLHAEWKISSKNNTKNGKRARRKEKMNVPSQNRGGAGCSSGSSCAASTSYGFSDDRSVPGRLIMSWKDVYSLAVKWRQISEPCDPVVWVNKLSEEFNSGFGSHTPMILGQAKVVRYFPNYQRTVDVAKRIMEQKLCVNNVADAIIDLSMSSKLQNLADARSCSDLYSIVGEDFWVATTCSSVALEGKLLEGTRITVQKIDTRGFDFAIRTPCTPSRWDDYDAEMAMAWEALCNAYCGEVYGSSDMSMLENVRHAILRMAYYWYNFMPLSRGSAAVGYVVLLGLFLAANMEVTECIPEGVQVDWEAILSPTLDKFADSISTWLYPSLKHSTSWKDHPDITSTFSTTGSVVAALSSSYND